MKYYEPGPGAGIALAVLFGIIAWGTLGLLVWKML